MLCKELWKAISRGSPRHLNACSQEFMVFTQLRWKIKNLCSSSSWATQWPTVVKLKVFLIWKALWSTDAKRSQKRDSNQLQLLKTKTCWSLILRGCGWTLDAKTNRRSLLQCAMMLLCSHGSIWWTIHFLWRWLKTQNLPRLKLPTKLFQSNSATNWKKVSMRIWGTDTPFCLKIASMFTI